MITKDWSMQSLPDMDQQQFEQWQSLLEDRTGMRISEQRKSFLQTSVGIRMRELGYSDYQTYFEEIMNGPAAAQEWTTLVDRLTVQETSFFRHRPSFEVVEEYLSQRVSEFNKPIEIWSVGCATGEEPYSLAMLANAVLGKQGKSQYFGVTGTDISVPALAKARQGIYSQRKLDNIDTDIRDRYFRSIGQQKFEVNPELKERVCFSRVNVLELNKAPMYGMDIIFCQNLLIYFRRWRRKMIVNCLVERLVPGGLLVLGLGEIVDWKHSDLRRAYTDRALAFIKHKAAN
ncbi:CheR family methyltransferase [Zooshikella sp. RANM57]|uniref:CheR family methyltransferase n=1 Tax=Zooshikella sp. RANM57 TaxID=3425863 RepID=UPI003D6F77BF